MLKHENTSTNWLNMVDSGQYSKSWQGTSDRFKNRVSKAQWQMALEQVRTPLGKMLKRTPTDIQTHTSLPGLPTGTYRVLKYNTEYEHKSDAIETLSLQLVDEQWRVIGYFIK